MRQSLYPAYMLILALWVGGMVMFTFLVTPALFKYLPRDEASRAVDRLLPLYFPYCLVLIIIAGALLIALGGAGSKAQFRASAVLIAMALAASLYLNFSLYPRIAEVKKGISSFETQESGTPAAFRRLHAASAVINLVLLADGAALLVIASVAGRRPPI